MKLSKKVKIEKGDFGYIRSQKKKRILITCCLFAITLLIYFTGLIQTKTRLNMFTFVAIMGCLPAGKSAVGMIMILMQKPISEEVYEKASKAAKSGTMFYELCFTTYEKVIPVDCLYISGSHVVGYASSEKADAPFLEKHLKEILKKEQPQPGSQDFQRPETVFGQSPVFGSPQRSKRSKVSDLGRAES